MRTAICILLLCFVHIFTLKAQSPIYALEYENSKSIKAINHFQGHFSLIIKTADWNGDGLPDILDLGRTVDFSQQFSFHFYLSVDTLSYVESDALNSLITDYFNSIEALDYEGDGDLDIVIMGTDQSGNAPLTRVLVNDGVGNFTEIANTQFLNLMIGDIHALDVDADGDQDVFLFGRINSSHTSQSYELLYLNQGGGSYRVDTLNSFTATVSPELLSGDLTGDGSPDLILSGSSFNLSLPGQSYVYINDGNGVFTEQSGNNLKGGDGAQLQLADFNMDGNLDLSVYYQQGGWSESDFNY